ncbi:MAG: LysR family transcriptional regulator, partial [Polyangiaceae bacterium]
TRGIVEDALGKTRQVRVSVASISYVADVVDGSPLLATVPALLARQIRLTRPHLRTLPLPFELEGAALELLWLRVKEDDLVTRFTRELLKGVGKKLGPPHSSKTKRK